MEFKLHSKGDDAAVPVVCLIASGNGTRRENHGDGVVGFSLVQCSVVQCSAMQACSVAMGDDASVVYKYIHSDTHVARWLSRHDDVPDKRPRLTMRLLASRGMERRRALVCDWADATVAQHTMCAPQVEWRRLAEARQEQASCALGAGHWAMSAPTLFPSSARVPGAQQSLQQRGEGKWK